MTDEQLVEYFKPYFTVTRPELAPKLHVRQEAPVDFAMKQKVQQLAELGIDVGYLLHRKKR